MTTTRLESARALVTDVLAGRITPESNRMLFDEDVVLFSVRIVEKDDPAWLLAQLANANYPLFGRIEVLNNVRDLYDAAYAILKRIAPDLV
jgi:hypothetical protein